MTTAHKTAEQPNNMPKIEKDVPIPSYGRHGFNATILRKLDVGDSIVIDTGHASNLHTAARFAGIKIVTRSKGGKIRVWRVA